MKARMPGFRNGKLAGIVAGLTIALTLVLLPVMAGGDKKPDSSLNYTELNLSDRLPFGKLISLVFRDMLLDHETELKITMINTSSNNTTGTLIIKAEKENIERKIRELENETSELNFRKNSSEIDEMEYIVELHRIKTEAESIHKESEELEKKVKEVSGEEDDLNVTEINQIKLQALNITGNITGTISQLLGLNITMDSIKKLEMEKDEGKTSIEAKVIRGNQTINIELEQRNNTTSKVEMEIKSGSMENETETEHNDTEEHMIRITVNDTEAGKDVKIRIVNQANSSFNLNNSKLYIIQDEQPVKIFNLSGYIGPHGNLTLVWNTTLKVKGGEYRALLTTPTERYDATFKVYTPDKMKKSEMENKGDQED